MELSTTVNRCTGGLAFGLLCGLTFGLFGGLIGGVSGLQLIEQLRIRPNQGIQRSGRNALRMGLVFGLLCGLLGGGLAFGLVGGLVGFRMLGGLVLVLVFPTGYATSEPKRGESPEK